MQWADIGVCQKTTSMSGHSTMPPGVTGVIGQKWEKAKRNKNYMTQGTISKKRKKRQAQWWAWKMKPDRAQSSLTRNSKGKWRKCNQATIVLCQTWEGKIQILRTASLIKVIERKGKDTGGPPQAGIGKKTRIFLSVFEKSRPLT